MDAIKPDLARSSIPRMHGTQPQTSTHAGREQSEGESPCVCCGARLGRDLMTAQDFDGGGWEFTLRECSQCGMVRTDPPPSAAMLDEAYRGEYYGNDSSKFVGVVERWTRFAARRRANGLLKSHAMERAQAKPRLRILDIGCGRGVLLDAFASLGHEVVGVERRGSPFEGLPHVVCGALDELGLAPGSFDIVVLWHVLEHLENPARVLAQVSALLDRQGSLFVSVPNFGSMQSRIFGRHWFHLDLPRHLFHFTDGSMERVLAENGLAAAERHSFSLDQNSYGFVQSALNSIPGLPDNQLYRLLKTPPSIRSIASLLAYAPALVALSVPMLIDLFVSASLRRGAVLTVKARKT